MKRILALTLAGVVAFSSTVFASDIPEEHWAYSYMTFGEYMGWCEKSQYKDNITYENADEILYDVLNHLMWNYTEFDRFFDVVNYTNGYVTRGEWADALKTAITMEYDEVVGMCAEEGINAIKSAESSEYSHKPMSFTDVASSYKYADAVSFCNDYKLMNGYEDNTFKADEYITYAEAMSGVYRLYDAENAILTDMGVDMDMFYEEYFGDYDDYEYGYGVLSDVGEKVSELVEMAENGTLKSTRKLSKDTEQAVEKYVGLDYIFENDSQLNAKANIAVSFDASALGVDVEGNFTIDVDGQVIVDENGDIPELALKINTKLDSPELAALMDLDETYTTHQIEYYLKDEVLYITDGEEKISVSYDKDEADDTLTMLTDGEVKLLLEYILKESVDSGSVKAVDGKESIVLTYDVKRLLSTLGFDMDKLIEESDSDISIEFSPMTTEMVVSSDNKLEESKDEMSGSFNVDGCKGEFNVKSNLVCNYEKKPIAYPDFSDYKDLISAISEDYVYWFESNYDEQEADDNEAINKFLLPTA